MPQARLCSCRGSRVLPLLLAYVCYLLLGATVFQLLEKQAEAQSRDQFQFEKLRFLENYTCLDQRALEQFVQVIMEAWVKGVNPKGNSTNPSNWDFGSSFFFAGTVVTTIGYGNLAPSTEAGQVFCVFYALVGIPLNAIFLNHLGAGLHAHLATLERWEEQPRRSQLLQILGLALFLTLGTLVILICPPMVFSHVEGWSFGEGFYFAFITLSTIGFGDYVVGTDPSKHYISVYRSLAAIWILLGLAWLALILPLGPLLLHSKPPLLRTLGAGKRRRGPEGTRRAPGSRPLRGPRLHGSRPGAPRLPGAVRTASPSGGGGGGGAGPQGPGARGAGHAAAAARLPGLPGPGHRRVLGAGGPRGARLQREVPARQVGSAAELHVPGRPGAGLADPGHHPSLPKWGHCPWQHHQHGALGVRGLLLLFRVYHHHHRLWQPEPPDHGRPPLLHLLCSCGDPAQPRGAQPTGASHAAGDAPLCPQAGGHLAGPGQSSVAGGLQHPPLRPLVFPAAAPAALLPHGGLELRGEFLLRLHHPQHRGLWRLCDWDGPLPEVPAVVQEYSVPMDPLWDGVAGLDHQTHPLPAGDTREIVFLSPQLQRELQGPKLEAEPGWGSRTQFATARMLSGGAYGNHPAPRTLYSGLMQWRGQLVIYYSMCSIFFLSNKTPRFKLGT